MLFQSPLIRGALIKRYKRFLADVRLDDGRLVTAHCANPGAMTGLDAPGLTVWLSTSDNPARKLRHSWELVETDMGRGPTLVGVNTSRPNAIAAEAIQSGAIPELPAPGRLRRETRYGENSRIDILLETAGQPACYVEVKNVHLMRRPGLAEFPDAVTARGAKHLRELAQMKRQGFRAVTLFLVQRGDAEVFQLARDIDPAYGKAFDEALAAGVEMLCYGCKASLTGVNVECAIPIAGLNCKPIARSRRRPR
jgi:sugar fermentation stimulation protein A